MNKKQRRVLAVDVDQNADVLYQVQQRPVTVVHLRYGYKDRNYSGIGYSKVCWPDWWNSEMGWRVARGKAISQIVRQIMKEERS